MLLFPMLRHICNRKMLLVKLGFSDFDNNDHNDNKRGLGAILDAILNFLNCQRVTRWRLLVEVQLIYQEQ